MTQKEVGELRRRFRLNKNAISHIYGCYVNRAQEIVSYLEEPMGRITEDEGAKYLGLLKKALSGQPGKQLMDIVFTTRQVMDSEEHRLLSALRNSGLKDAAARNAFYQKIIDSADMGEEGYLILLAHDAYDVPHRPKDNTVQADASDTVFSYIVCVLCPVKERKAELGFFPGDNEFHSCAGQIVAPPECGFLFPAFDDRAANIYNALFYSRKPEELHHEVIDAVFHTEPPMSAAEQREAFEGALQDALGEQCSVEVVQALHEQLREKMEAHKESRDPEPLTVTAAEIGSILEHSGISAQQIAAFQARCGERFGEGAVLSPANLIDSRRFEVRAGGNTLLLEPSESYLLESRTIDGKRYLMLPVDSEVEVNGMAVQIR